MAVLIIGAGLVGSQIARILVEEGERPVILDLAPQPEALADIVDPEKLTLRRGDILNPLDIVRVLRQDAITRVIHTAANPLLTLGAQQDPYGAIQVNIMGTVNVLEAARLHGLERVVVTSSSVLAYYLTGGEDQGDAHREEAFPRPATFYSATKQAVESLGLNYARWCNLDVLAVRFGAVAGPWRGHGGGGPSNIFRSIVERALRGEEATVPATTMDWVYSKDAAAGSVLALRARGTADRVFNISMGTVADPKDIIAAVQAVVPGARIRIETQQATALSVKQMDRPIDITRARKQLGYVPKFDLRGAVADYVAWYRTRRS